MRASRYVAVIVGAALAVSFALPGAVSAQEDKWREAFNAYQQNNFSRAETLFRDVCAEYEDAGQPWGWCHLMLGATLGQMGPSKRQEALAQLEIAKELVTEDGERYQAHSSIANIHLLDRTWSQAIAAATDAEPFANAEQAGLLSKIKGQAYYQLMDYRNTPAEEFRVLLREVFRACGDKDHPDWEEYDQAMVKQDAVVVLVAPERVYGRLP